MMYISPVNKKAINKDLELVEKISKESLKEITKGLEEYYAENLLSVFVTGSMYHGAYSKNQDIDLLYIVKEVEDNDPQKFKSIIKKSWDGQLTGYTPVVPEGVEQIFKNVKNRYDSNDVEIVYKFIITKFVHKPIKDITINFHVISPMSIDQYRIFAEIYAFALITMVNNCIVLYGHDPRKLVKIKPTKELFFKWLNTHRKRVYNIIYDFDLDRLTNIDLLCKEIIKVSNDAIVLLGFYNNEKSEIADMFYKNIDILLKQFPLQAVKYKISPHEVIDNPVKLKKFIDETSIFFDQVQDYFQK